MAALKQVPGEGDGSRFDTGRQGAGHDQLEVARMVRQYKRKGKTPWPDKDRRMAAAVRKRAEGKNNCQIAGELGVTEGTVRNDLKRWAALNPANVLPLTRKSDSKSRPAGGNFTSRFYEPEDSAPKIRRIH